MILIVEDDLKVRSALEKGLIEVGHEVVAVSSAGSAMEMISSAEPRLIVLDLGLPDMDGEKVLQHARRSCGDLPIIILTARDSIDDRVAGLDAGADDYLVKPFAFPELLARIRVHLRRRELSTILRVGELTLDPKLREVRCGDGALELTPLEFDILRCMMEHAGGIVTHDMLASEVWRMQANAMPIGNIIHVHVSHLRSKLEDASGLTAIKTVRGMGYMLEVDR